MQTWEERTLEREKGRAEGIAKGIEAVILDNLEEGIEREKIIQKLEKRFKLNREKAEEYYKEYAK